MMVAVASATTAAIGPALGLARVAVDAAMRQHTLEDARAELIARATHAASVSVFELVAAAPAVLDVATPQFAMPRDAATPPSGCAAATT